MTKAVDCGIGSLEMKRMSKGDGGNARSGIRMLLLLLSGTKDPVTISATLAVIMRYEIRTQL
jgi:hypothetical protein